METLWNLYQLRYMYSQSRLNQLNTTFLHLLNQFQHNQLLTTPELAKYRIEYIGSMVDKILKNDQEKLIVKLYQEIDHLRSQNQKLHKEIALLTKNTYHSQQIQPDTKQKSLSSTKVSTVYRKTHNEEQMDEFMGSCSSKLGKRRQTHMKSSTGFDTNQKHKQTIFKQSQIKQREQQPEEEDQLQLINMKFKYLKL